jgi:hypothetical protein
MIKAEDKPSEFDHLVTTVSFSALEENIILSPEMEEEQIMFGKRLNLTMENPKWEDLSNAEKTNLRDMAVDYYYTTAGKKAVAILNTYYGEDHIIPPYYQGAPGEVRAFLETLKTLNTIQFIEVFPNPANDYLNIKVHLEMATITNQSLTVYNALGQPLQTLKVFNANQQFALDLQNYSNGNCTILLHKGEKILQTLAFNVVC